MSTSSLRVCNHAPPGQTLLCRVSLGPVMLLGNGYKWVLISGKIPGIIKGFGWPYDGVRC